MFGHGQQLIAVWSHRDQAFREVVRGGPSDHRPIVEHDDYGDGGFTGQVAIMHTTGPFAGRPVLFRLKDHIDRFERTVRAVRSIKQLPCSRRALIEAILRLVDNNRQPYVRCSIAGGGGVKVYAPGEPPRLYICTESINPITRSYLGAEVVEHGLRVMITKKRRGYPDEETFAKSRANYLRSINATDIAKEAGYDEGALVDHTGTHLSELSVANIMLLMDGHAVTPNEASGRLDSITRQTAEAMLAERGIETVARPITPEMMMQAKEVFACGTAIGFSRIRELAWPEAGVTWRLTLSQSDQLVPKLDADYLERLQGHRVDHHPEWYTPVPEGVEAPPKSTEPSKTGKFDFIPRGH